MPANKPVITFGGAYEKAYENTVLVEEIFFFEFGRSARNVKHVRCLEDHCR